MKCIMAEVVGDSPLADFHVIEITPAVLTWLATMREYVGGMTHLVGEDACLQVWGASLPYRPLRMSFVQEPEEESPSTGDWGGFGDGERIVEWSRDNYTPVEEDGSGAWFKCVLSQWGVYWVFKATESSRFSDEETIVFGWEVFGMEPLVEEEPKLATPDELKGIVNAITA